MLNMNNFTKLQRTALETNSNPQQGGGMFGPSLIPVAAMPLNGIKYDFDISEIGHSEDFQQLLHVLRVATPDDEVHLHINSGGGSLYTAIQICSAIAESEAKCVSAHAEGIVASAATLIFLGCSQWKISPLATFMFHTSSSVEVGKMPDMLKSIKAHKAHLNVICNALYKNFLTDEEIDNVINKNDDMWLTAEEASDRLTNMLAVEDAIAEKEQNKINNAIKIAKTSFEEAVQAEDEKDIEAAEAEEKVLNITFPELTATTKKPEMIEIYNGVVRQIVEAMPSSDLSEISKNTSLTKSMIVNLYYDIIDDLTQAVADAEEGNEE